MARFFFFLLGSKRSEMAVTDFLVCFESITSLFCCTPFSFVPLVCLCGGVVSLCRATLVLPENSPLVSLSAWCAKYRSTYWVSDNHFFPAHGMLTSLKIDVYAFV
jgi:hypothetical protein